MYTQECTLNALVDTALAFLEKLTAKLHTQVLATGALLNTEALSSFVADSNILCSTSAD